MGRRKRWGRRHQLRRILSRHSSACSGALVGADLDMNGVAGRGLGLRAVASFVGATGTRRLPLFCGVAVTVVGLWSAVDAQQAGYLVNKDHLRCVIDNIDRYKSSPKNPVIIFLEICPETELTPEVLAGMVTNELPTIKGTPTPPDKPERHLSLRKADLGCLARFKNLVESSTESTVLLPANICGR
jgi:hypothetical protein